MQYKARVTTSTSQYIDRTPTHTTISHDSVLLVPFTMQ